MPYSVVRFNCIQPGLEPVEMSARYQAFVDMAELRRRARPPGHLAGGAPRCRQRLEPVAADHGRTRLRSHQEDHGHARRAARAVARPASARRGHRGARPRQRRALRGHRRHRLPRERVRGARQGLGEARRAAGRSDRHDAQGVDRRAVRVPRHHRAGDAASVHAAASHADARRLEQGRGAPRRALRPAVPAAGQPARARGLLLRAVRGARHAGLLRDAARAHRDDVTSPRTPTSRGPTSASTSSHEASTYAAWQTAGHRRRRCTRTRTSVDELRAEGIYEVVHARRARRPPEGRRADSATCATCTRSSAGCRSTRGGSRCASTSKRSCPHWAEPVRLSRATIPRRPPTARVGQAHHAERVRQPEQRRRGAGRAARPAARWARVGVDADDLGLHVLGLAREQLVELRVAHHLGVVLERVRDLLLLRGRQHRARLRHVGERRTTASPA